MKSRPPATAQPSSFEITSACLLARQWKRQATGTGASGLTARLLHGFSTRHATREQFFSELFPDCQPVLLHQIHSDRIHVIGRAPADPGRRPGSGRLHGDAMITGRPGLALAVRTADCLPLLLFDPRRRAIGAVHAGWRGTLARIAEKTVGAMRAHFGSDPAGIQAVIGPGIQACCYEVGQEVIEKFRSQFPYAEDLFRTLEEENPADIYLPRQLMIDGQPFLRDLAPARAKLDLVEANRRQLREAGLRSGNIISGAPCTACRTDLLFSYRREGRAAGRLYAVIALAE